MLCGVCISNKYTVLYTVRINLYDLTATTLHLELVHQISRKLLDSIMGKKYISPRDEKNVQFLDKKSYFDGHTDQ